MINVELHIHSETFAVPSTILLLLQQYDFLFQEPTLPPDRIIKHKFYLTEGGGHVDAKPYWYPKKQK